MAIDQPPSDTCPKCHAALPPTGSVCPNCRAQLFRPGVAAGPKPKGSGRGKAWLIILGIIVLGVIVAALTGNKGTSSTAQPTQAPTAAVAAAPPAPPAAAAPTSPPTAAPKPTAPPATATTPPKPTEPPKPSVAKVGDRVESAGVAITVAKVDKAAAFGQFFKPKAGNTYLATEVIVENAGRDSSTPYNPLYFKVKDSDGFEYTTALTGPEPLLKTGELAKGEKARGWIAYEVKSEAKGFSLSYQPIVIFGGYQVIRIDLGV